MKTLIIAIVLIASNSQAAEILACKPQELVTKSTKSGFSTRLANKSESEAVYILDGKRVSKDEAVRFAVANMKPIQK